MPRKERGQYVISSLIKQQKTKEKKEDKNRNKEQEQQVEDSTKYVSY